MIISFNELEQKKSDESVGVGQKKQDILRKKYFQKHCQAIDNVKELGGRLPQKGEIFFLWSLKSFNAFTFIQYIILECEKIDELFISSYNVGKVIILSLMHLVDEGLVKNLHMLVSDVSKSRFPHNYELMNLEASRRSVVTVSYRWNHSKVALARCGDKFLVLEGSGNFADNARHEQYLFTDDKELFEFRKNWMINEID